MLAVPRGHDLADAQSVGLTSLKGLALALPDVDFGVRRIFDRACARVGLPLAPVLTSNVFETLRDFVRTGAGVAILPMRAIARQKRAGVLAAVALEDMEFRNTAIDIVVRRRRLPRVVTSFVAGLQVADVVQRKGFAPGAEGLVGFAVFFTGVVVWDLATRSRR